MKQVSRFELDAFLRFAPAYFHYMSEAFFSEVGYSNCTFLHHPDFLLLAPYCASKDFRILQHQLQEHGYRKVNEDGRACHGESILSTKD